MGIKVLNRGEAVSLSGGDTLEVRGADVVRVDSKTGAVKVYPQGKDIVVDGAAIVPPFGTRPRQFPGELGTRRLHLGDGYAIHGTDKAASIGTAASHGCIRMLNEEIEILYDLVPVHTPVFIY